MSAHPSPPVLDDLERLLNAITPPLLHWERWDAGEQAWRLTVITSSEDPRPPKLIPGLYRVLVVTRALGPYRSQQFIKLEEGDQIAILADDALYPSWRRRWTP